MAETLTPQQKAKKKLYPLIMLVTRLLGRNRKILMNGGNLPPSRSFFDLQVQLNNGKQVSLSAYRGRKVLLVNTASDCGYTGQYAELQELYTKYKGQLEILGFPANDFKEQEKGSDEEIASFCQLNYGVSFPLAKKSVVINSDLQHPVFRWLTNRQENGWNDQKPSWNFSKYLVNEQGLLTHYFDPSVSPLSEPVLKAINLK